MHGERVLASAELARTRAERRRGLSGRSELEGVLVLQARSVHTFGMRMDLDVAFCDARGRVRRIVTLPPNRVTRVHLGAPRAIEAPAGSFRAWGVDVGDTLELR